MKKKTFFVARGFFALAAGLLITAFTLFGCDGTGTSSESFASYLRGTWVSTRTLYYPWEMEGRLVIGYDFIAINGSVLPFDAGYPSGYTKGIALTGYSVESGSTADEKIGAIFIKDKGELKSVPYVRWSAASEYMLTVGIAPDNETFRKE